MARGRQDTYLTGTPQMTFFKHVYRRYQPFAIESIPIELDGTPQWEQRLSCLIPRKADLLSQMFLEIDLPRLPQISTPGDAQDNYWVNNIGHVLIQDISIEIGEKEIDKHVGQWLHIWDELTVPPGLRAGYNEMIGHWDSYPTAAAKGPLSLQIPLRFWFCRNIGAALPLIALQAHPVRIIMHLAPFNNLWWSDEVLPPTPGQPCPTIPITQPTRIQLYGDYVYLEQDERRMFAAREHEYLITQLQIAPTQTAPPSQLNVQVPLYFNHCCTEMIWVVQETRMENYKEWYNFSSGLEYIGSETSKDLLAQAILRLDGYDRFQVRPARYFRLTQPYQHHTNIPDGQFIYLYSFALRPEDEQPSGTINCSKIDNIVWNLSMDSTTTVYNGQPQELQIFFYAVNYNILRIVGGLGGVAFIA